MFARRTCLGLLGVSLTWAFDAQSQPAPKTIGFLGANTAASAGHLAQAFEKRLGDLGWTVGRSVVIVYRWANGETAKFGEIARQFVEEKVDVIVTSGNAPALAARRETSTIPIVVASSADIMATGLVQSLAHPGGNVTGLTFAPEDTIGKRVELLTEILPGSTRLSVLYNPDANLEEVAALRRVADGRGLAVEAVEFRQVADLERLIRSPDPAIRGLIVISDPLVFVNRQKINAAALAARYATVHRLREYVEDGGLLSYGPTFPEFFRRAADFVDKILRGAKPGDLPIEGPSRLELIVNMKTAKVLALDIPGSILARASELID